MTQMTVSVYLSQKSRSESRVFKLDRAADFKIRPIVLAYFLYLYGIHKRFAESANTLNDLILKAIVVVVVAQKGSSETLNCKYIREYRIAKKTFLFHCVFNLVLCKIFTLALSLEVTDDGAEACCSPFLKTLIWFVICFRSASDVEYNETFYRSEVNLII